MTNVKLRIGISTRVTNAATYEERRDSLAQDWSKYFSKAIPEAQWMSLPNIESAIVDYVKKWEINAVILSGGENLGVSPERDQTEMSLYRYAMEQGFPVIGVCRGLQLVYQIHGGSVMSQGDDFAKIHRAQEHMIGIGALERNVNSYHNNELIASSLPSDLKVLATCKADDTIEAVYNESFIGIMWHPERNAIFQDWDAALIRNFLYNKQIK
jgi:putative glutamine amidotransferase